MQGNRSVPTDLARAIMFATSFAPVSALLGVRYWPRDHVLSIVLWLLTLLLLELAWGFERVVLAADPWSDTVITVEPVRESIAGYLTGYLLPFVLVDLSDPFAMAAAAVFVVIIGAAYVQARLIYLNPLYLLAGYRLWHVTANRKGLANTTAYLLVSRRDIVPVGAVLEVRTMDAPGVMLDGWRRE